MSKTIKNCFYKNITFEKFLSAHKRAKKHKTYKTEVIMFELNLENNITNIMNSIRNNKYSLGKYYSFKVYEPKERNINALPYKDRIVHQWYVEEFIKPYIIPKFIDTSFACLTNRGTHKAVEYLQKKLQEYSRKYKNFWILKCDIKGFFYNIDQEILINIMKKYISDKRLLDFTKLLITGNSHTTQVGIPIGNLTSQYFANIYLNELDYFVKHHLKIPVYIRYMDDFVMLIKTKKEAKDLKEKINIFITNNLKLELNAKSRYYPASMGVDFCGYRIFPTHKLLRNNSKKKIKKKVKKWNYEYSQNKLDYYKTLQSINSWRAHVSHCNSYKLEQKILNSCTFLYDNNYTNSIDEKHLILQIDDTNV